ncbi:MAG: VanZ family protein [Bacteroidales bacterium]|nr:VanZ family protein [Bacteroidales bacterium]
MTRRQLIWARILFGVYLLTVAWLCFGQFDNTPDVPWSILGIPSDKIVHFCMFLPFPFLAYLAFDRYTDKFWPSLLWTVASFVAGVLVAAGTEIGQARLTTYRSGDKNDFLADLLALAVGSVIVFLIDIRKQRKS